MCRMILAIGKINVSCLIDAATEMSRGENNGWNHKYSSGQNSFPILKHFDGWGMIFTDANKAIRCHRSALPIEHDPDVRELRKIRTDFLIIHTRSASVKNRQGIAFTHPVESMLGNKKSFFFHNGFSPDVHNLLERSESNWDSLELFEWITNESKGNLSIHFIKKKLSKLPFSTTSANFFLVLGDDIYICNWFPKDSKTPLYYSMHSLIDSEKMIISSEPIVHIGKEWSIMSNMSIQKLTFK